MGAFVLLGILGLTYLSLEIQNKKTTNKLRKNLEIVIVSIYSYLFLLQILTFSPFFRYWVSPLSYFTAILMCLTPFVKHKDRLIELMSVFLFMLNPLFIVLGAPLFGYCVMKWRNKGSTFKKEWVLTNIALLSLFLVLVVFNSKITILMDNLIFFYYFRKFPTFKKKIAKKAER